MDRPRPYQADETLLEMWLAGRPPIIHEMAHARPPWTCYRMRDPDSGRERGHYWIYSYNESGTVTIDHGDDSYLPGVRVFGIEPNSLVTCGCGNWHPPTAEQAEATGKRIERMRLDRN